MYELGVIPSYRSQVSGQEGLGLLEGSLVSLPGAMEFASRSEEQVKSLRQLLGFVENLRISPPCPNPQDQYKAPTRSMGDLASSLVHECDRSKPPAYGDVGAFICSDACCLTEAPRSRPGILPKNAHRSHQVFSR